MADTTTTDKFQTLADQLKEAQIQQEIRKANTWTYGEEIRLTEAQAKNTSGEMTDIFKQQESFNQSILKVMEGLTGGDTTPTYVTAQAPAQEQSKSPNYLVWVGAAIIAYLLFMRKKR